MDAPSTISELNGVFGSFLTIIVSFAGIALLFTLIFGGYKYITSGGDPKNKAAAQQMITWAIYGFLLVAGAIIIINIIAYITGVQSILQFNLYFSGVI